MTLMDLSFIQKDGVAYQTLKRLAPLRMVVQQTRNMLSRYRPAAWRLEGCVRDGDAPLSIVFAGQVESKNYLAHLAFSDPPTEATLGPQWVVEVLPPARAMAKADIAIAELDPWQRRLLRDRFDFHLPCWVGGDVDIERAVSHIRASKNAKEDLRRIRRDKFGYRIEHGAEALERFYLEMYRPYIDAVYGDRAFAMSYREMMERCDCSELFVVTMRDEPVAGLIILYEADGPRAWSLGVRRGDRGYVKAGALRALDYLLLFHLAEKGCRRVHMGASRPFLNDGVLRHKRRLGLRLNGGSRLGFGVRLSAPSRGAETFLRNNPFIFENDDVYRGAIFVERSFSVSALDERQRWWREYGMEGLRDVSLLTCDSREEIARFDAKDGTDDLEK